MGEVREAAVVVPFYRDDQQRLRLVLIERTPRGRHAGQLAFPGGNREPADRDSRDTALREAGEELGLSRADIHLIEELPAVHTATTGYRVWPFVARLSGVSPDQHWRRQEQEVAEVLDVPLAELADPGAAGEEELSFPGWSAPRRVPVRHVRGRLLRGLTLRILDPLLERADSLPL